MLLELKSCSHSIDDKHILSDIDFSLNSGEIISIVGPSGAGKSSMLKILAGKLIPSKGEVFLLGKKQHYKNQLIPGNDEIGYASQEFNEDNYFTVKENIARNLLHLTKEDKELFCQELLNLVKLNELSNTQARYLSGGEKQRLTLACTLAFEPKVLLLDEPFSHLDIHLRNSIGTFLKKLALKQEISVVLVTHQGEEALSWSNKIFFLNKGKISSEYTPKEAYFNSKNKFEGAFFGELNVINFYGKELIFRPTEFSLENNFDKKINIHFKYSEFRGFYNAFYFITDEDEQIVLYSKENLERTTVIYAK